MEGNCLMHTGFPFGVMEMFWNWIKMIVAQYDEYSKCYRIIHVKMVNFMLCEFYFTKKKKKMDTVRLYLDFVDQGLQEDSGDMFHVIKRGHLIGFWYQLGCSMGSRTAWSLPWQLGGNSQKRRLSWASSSPCLLRPLHVVSPVG